VRSSRCIAAFLLSALVAPATGAKEDAATVTLRWAMAAWKRGADSPVAVDGDLALESGDRIRFLVGAPGDVAVYLIHVGPSGGVELLHPPKLPAPGAPFPSGTARIPSQGWALLDGEEGRETFFLLASAERLTALEDLLIAHEPARGPARSELSSEIQEELRRILRTRRPLAQPALRPAFVSGATRGDFLDEIAVAIESRDFFARTITIEHHGTDEGS
jgi:hypothetical protein